MRIDVQITGNLALLEYVPPIAARILFGRRTTEQYAVLRGGCWTDDVTGRLVDAATDAAISAALRSVRAATAPPG